MMSALACGKISLPVLSQGGHARTSPRCAMCVEMPCHSPKRTKESPSIRVLQTLGVIKLNMVTNPGMTCGIQRVRYTTVMYMGMNPGVRDFETGLRVKVKFLLDWVFKCCDFPFFWLGHKSPSHHFAVFHSQNCPISAFFFFSSALPLSRFSFSSVFIFDFFNILFDFFFFLSFVFFAHFVHFILQLQFFSPIFICSLKTYVYYSILIWFNIQLFKNRCNKNMTIFKCFKNNFIFWFGRNVHEQEKRFK